MIRLRKYAFLFLLSLILLLVFGGRGYDCVSDEISLERFESKQRLQVISGLITIIGEGAFFHKKALKDFGNSLPFIATAIEAGLEFTSFIVHIGLDSHFPLKGFVYKDSIYIAISSLRI